MKPTAVHLLAATLTLLAARMTLAADEPYIHTVDQFLHQKFDPRHDCIVVGFVDQSKSRILAAGSLDNGTDRPVDGDSLFFIGSVTKTFTALLAQDMADRDEITLTDPVARYLPPDTKLPTRNNKQITLLDLATHAAALPFNPDNMVGKDGREQYETYTVEKMLDFLSYCQLPRDPGAQFAYSNIGFALLGNALERKANTTYEQLILQHICRPLDMNDTCITPSPQQKNHLAVGHDEHGNPATPWNLQAYIPAGSIHSTGDDLLKYAAAQAGITPSPLADAIEKTHIIRHEDIAGLTDAPGWGPFGHTAMDWVDHCAFQPPGMALLAHAGGAGSYHAFVGFDMKQHRAVIVLSTSNDLSVEAVGFTLLQEFPLTPDSCKKYACELVGIGVALDIDKTTGNLHITKVLPQSPAALAGLTSGSTIQKNGDTPVQGIPLKNTLDLLRGNAGTQVHLDLLDPAGKPLAVDITRRKFLISPAT